MISGETTVEPVGQEVLKIRAGGVRTGTSIEGATERLTQYIIYFGQANTRFTYGAVGKKNAGTKYSRHEQVKKGASRFWSSRLSPSPSFKGRHPGPDLTTVHLNFDGGQNQRSEPGRLKRDPSNPF
jgi:hypothetical protein